jgi:hypothetical protein
VGLQEGCKAGVRMEERGSRAGVYGTQTRRKIRLVISGVVILLLIAFGRRIYSNSAHTFSGLQSGDALALLGVQRARTCPEKLLARYGKDRFNLPFQSNMKNIKFAPGLSVEDAHFCNPSLSLDKAAVLIESRPDPYMIPHLLHFIQQVGDDWPFIIYHSKYNEEMRRGSRSLKKYIDSGKIQLHRINLVFRDHDSVSVFLTHRAIYDNLAPAKHLFLFQLDSTICANSRSKLEDYFQYDFIGAPISNKVVNGDLPRYNGGFSLRNRLAFLDIIETVPEFQTKGGGNPFTYEDQWFSHEFHKSDRYRLPSNAEASEFSVETLYHPTPFGVHRPQDLVVMSCNEEQRRHLIDVWCPDMYAMTPKTGPETFRCRNNQRLPECQAN